MVVGIDWYDNIDNEHSGARFYRSEIRESEALATTVVIVFNFVFRAFFCKKMMSTKRDVTRK